MKHTLFPLIILVAFLAGCGKDSSQQSQVNLKEDPSAAVAGIRWLLPERWTTQDERPMRVATYTIPAAEGDGEPGECAVFYFGGGQGGDIDMNIQRWGSQFEDAGAAEKSSSQVNGLNVTRVEIAGTYLAPGGPMMESQGRKENFRLLGAIVEGPEGTVFYKFTGPANTLNAAKGEFDAMVGSIKK
ncbi:MAG: hypothetical protein WEE20_08425 [Bacteroidota bacterium]